MGLFRAGAVPALFTAIVSGLLPVSGPSAQEVGFGSSAGRVRDAIQSVASGTHDVHFSLPAGQPLLYSLSFEFADELSGRCRGLFPNAFARQRDALWWSYVHYSYWRQDSVTDLRLPPNLTLAAAALRVLEMRDASAYPAVQVRRQIAPDVASLVTTLLAVAGGCGSAQTRDVAANLVAIGTFGRLARSTFEATLIRREDTDNGLGFLCVHKGDDRTSEKVQGYRKIGSASLGRETTLGEFIGAIERSRSERQFGSGSRIEVPLIRADCPLTIDPHFHVSLQTVFPDTRSLAGSPAERMADYFIERYIPDLGLKSTGIPLQLSAAELARLRQEIIRYESLPVTREEIDAQIAQTLRKDRENGVRSPQLPLERQRLHTEQFLRTTKYREAGGGPLFDLTRRENGVPNYLAARDLEVMLTLRGEMRK